MVCGFERRTRNHQCHRTRTGADAGGHARPEAGSYSKCYAILSQASIRRSNQDDRSRAHPGGRRATIIGIDELCPYSGGGWRPRHGLGEHAVKGLSLPGNAVLRNDKKRQIYVGSRCHCHGRSRRPQQALPEMKARHDHNSVPLSLRTCLACA